MRHLSIKKRKNTLRPTAARAMIITEPFRETDHYCAHVLEAINTADELIPPTPTVAKRRGLDTSQSVHTSHGEAHQAKAHYGPSHIKERRERY